MRERMLMLVQQSFAGGIAALLIPRIASLLSRVPRDEETAAVVESKGRESEQERESVFWIAQSHRGRAARFSR